MELPIEALQQRPGLLGLRIVFCIIWLITPLPINGVSWLWVFWAGNRLLWDTQGPSLEHACRAVHAGWKGAVQQPGNLILS